MAMPPRFPYGSLVTMGNHSSLTVIDPVTGLPVQVGAFKNAAGVATDPTSATLLVRSPDGVLATYSWPSVLPQPLTRETIGRFYVDRLVTQYGVWRWVLDGDGAVEVATPDQVFEVPVSKVRTG